MQEQRGDISDIKSITDSPKLTSVSSSSTSAQGAKSSSLNKTFNVTNPDGSYDFKPIHSAVRWNKYDDTVALLKHPSAANAQDITNGNYPIHIAAQNGHLDTIKLLVTNKAIVNAKNSKGNTPLHMAVGYDYNDVVKYLLENGGDLSICNDANVPAENGLEGDKCLGIVAFICAKTATEAIESMALCETTIDKVNKVSFVQTGLKLKKALGAEWTSDIQDKFKAITIQLK